jgi:hypothetical protein
MTMWVVLNEDDEVMVMASGRDASSFVEEWATRGYHVVCIDAADVHAA